MKFKTYFKENNKLTSNNCITFNKLENEIGNIGNKINKKDYNNKEMNILQYIHINKEL